jgi:hypothetical protein
LGIPNATVAQLLRNSQQCKQLLRNSCVLRRLETLGGRVRRLLIRELAEKIWHIDDEVQSYQLGAYQDHYRSSVRLIVDDNVAFADVSDVLDLIASLEDSTKTVRELKSTLNGTQNTFLKAGANETSLEVVLKFAARLWLFVPIDESMANESLTLKQLIEQELSSMNTTTSPGGHQSLSEDLCEKNLTRKAGIQLNWTSNLCEHLEMVNKSQLKVFRHSSILTAFDGGEERYVSISPIRNV